VLSASLLLSGPGCCSPRRRLPGAASSRYREVGRGRRGRHGQQAATASVAGVQHAVSTHPGFGVRDPAVRPSGVRSPGVVVQSVRRSAVCCPPVQRPAVCCPSRAVSSRLVSIPCGVQPSGVCPRPSGRVRLLPCSGGGVGDPGRGGRDAGDAAEVAVGQGGSVATRAAGLGGGRGGRACPLSDQAGQAGVRSARRRRLRGGHGSGLQREVAALAAWLASSRPRWVVVAEPDARVGGPGGARGVPARGWACGPSAAQASSERAQLGAGSAVTCDDGWWAWLDLNLGPHPYQRWTAERCAIQHFRWSCHSVRPTRMG
jgi:hypothetical protein